MACLGYAARGFSNIEYDVDLEGHGRADDWPFPG
jgi:hypothetical protein